MIISKKRLEKIVNDRTAEEKWRQEIGLKIEIIQETLGKLRRRVNALDDFQPKYAEEMRLRIEELREMLLKNCGKQPQENAEKE